MFKILIIDDDSLRVDKLLNKLSFSNKIDTSNIYRATSIVEAKILLKNNSFNVLILDIVLPNRNDEAVLQDGGIKILEYIENNIEVCKPTRIIGITSYKENESKYLSEFSKRCFTLIHVKFNSTDWINQISQAISYSQKAFFDTSQSEVDSVLITLHGIRTYGQWHERLEKVVDANFKNVYFLSYKYGVFSLISFFFPPSRLIQILLFYKHIKAHKSLLIDKDIYFVAHSFGTYILAKSLAYYSDFFKELNIIRIIFAGSVLKSRFNWVKLFEKYSFQLVNDCGSSDYILCLSQIFVPGVGMAGRSGFVGLNNGRMVNRFFEGGHSLYFDNKTNQTDFFFIKYWLDCFNKNSTLKVVDRRKDSFFVPFFEFILNFLGFIKELFFYLVIIYLFLILF